MIYPTVFPYSSESVAEKTVFEALSKISNKCDIFYSRRFLKINSKEREEYEIDFIIAFPNKFILCLEVKGGIIRYEGRVNKWFQNSKELNPSPDIQASANSHNLIERYKELSNHIPIEWAVCFPDCEIPPRVNLPPNINQNRILDRDNLNWLEYSLSNIISNLSQLHPGKTICKDYIYNNFKSDILRDLNFVQKLGSTIKQDEDKFIELTETQILFFSKVLENKKIITRGPSGSGKTIIAKTIAKDFANENNKVLLLCYNRTLANKIRYESGIYHNKNIVVDTFHSHARNVISVSFPDWWQHQNTKSIDFWELELPSKFEETVSSVADRFDVIVIDEGQDFADFWFDAIFKLLKSEGRFYIFLDEMQNIFSRFKHIPNEDTFIKYKLEENCRNTKNIVKYLENVSKSEIKCFYKSPEGSPVIIKEFSNQSQEFDFVRKEIHDLISNHNVKPNQILLLLNTDKSNSCIKNVDKIGNYKLSYLDNKARFDNENIHYTTINVFKGLEIDILFILDSDKINNANYNNSLYTQASRAKHKLYILKANLI